MQSVSDKQMTSVELENEMLIEERNNINQQARKMQMENEEMMKEVAKKKEYKAKGLNLIEDVEAQIREVVDELMNMYPVHRKTEELKWAIEVEKVNRPFLQETVDELKRRNQEMQMEYKAKLDEIQEWTEKYSNLREELFYLENPNHEETPEINEDEE